MEPFYRRVHLHRRFLMPKNKTSRLRDFRKSKN